MPFLVRKIDKGKWLARDIANGADVAADAITSCLRTTNNTLSAWRVESEAEVEEVALAMTSNADHLETIDLVLLEEGLLTQNAFQIRHAPETGLTPIQELKQRHYDLLDLTYGSLGAVAKFTVTELVSNRTRRFTKGDLKKIVRVAIDKQRLTIEQLKESVRKKVA